MINIFDFKHQVLKANRQTSLSLKYYIIQLFTETIQRFLSFIITTSSVYTEFFEVYEIYWLGLIKIIFNF